MKLLKCWSICGSFAILVAVFTLCAFVSEGALSEITPGLVFGDTGIFAAVFRGEPVWEGLWSPISGTLRLIVLVGIFAIPAGLSAGIYLSEYAGAGLRRALLTMMEALAGIPSIIVGLFGFVLILFLNRYSPAGTGMLLSSFCLGILVLPALSVNTYAALSAIPENLRVVVASAGLSKHTALTKIYLPQASEGLLGGLLLAAGRCAEDTAVILMTGAVALSIKPGLFDKFEALPFFIYYTSANYQDERQLAQVFLASVFLLLITLILLGAGMFLQSKMRRAN